MTAERIAADGNLTRSKVEDIKDIAKVHVDSWRTTYRGIVPADYLNSLNYKEFEDKWKSRSVKGVFVAQDEKVRYSALLHLDLSALNKRL